MNSLFDFLSSLILFFGLAGGWASAAAMPSLSGPALTSFLPALMQFPSPAVYPPISRVSLSDLDVNSTTLCAHYTPFIASSNRILSASNRASYCAIHPTLYLASHRVCFRTVLDPVCETALEVALASTPRSALGPTLRFSLKSVPKSSACFSQHLLLLCLLLCPCSCLCLRLCAFSRGSHRVRCSVFYCVFLRVCSCVFSRAFSSLDSALRLLPFLLLCASSCLHRFCAETDIPKSS